MNNRNGTKLYSADQIDDSELQNIFEALLFASDRPITVSSLIELIPEIPGERWRKTIERLINKYREERKGIFLQSIDGGFMICTNEKHDFLIRQYLKKERKKALSQASLETLAIIAYRQPLTSSDIEEIRGVNAAGVLRTLLEKRLIKTIGRKLIPGRPFLYGTTREFLRHFGLSSLEELPKVEELGELLDEKE